MSQRSTSRSYTLPELRSFVISEIRPALSQEGKRAWIKIFRRCNDSVTDIRLQHRTDDYSLTNINGTEVDGSFYEYDEQNIEISKENFARYFSAGEKYAQKSKSEQREVLKYFSYLFAEAARFEAIEERIDDLFLRNCRVNWAESKRLFRRWGRLSAFAFDANIADHSYSGGNNNHLYAPVSKFVIAEYSKETLDGNNSS